MIRLYKKAEYFVYENFDDKFGKMFEHEIGRNRKKRKRMYMHK